MTPNQHPWSPRWVPIVLGLSFFVFVAGSVPFMLGGAPLGDDHSAHLALAVHIAELIADGSADFFWGNSNLGLPLFASYQPLPSLTTGLLITLLPQVSAVTLFKAIIVLLWASLPVTWYAGARWLGMCQRQALILSLLTLTIRSEWHVGLALTSSAYTGLYTQVWGLWLLPLTVGAFARAFLKRDVRWPWASLLLSLTLMCHLFIGFMAGIACACLALSQPKVMRRIVPGAALHLAVTFGLCAFWLIPLLTTRDYLGGLPWLNANYDGWGLAQTLVALVRGDVLDAGRWALLSGLAGIGMVLAIMRIRGRHELRALVLFGFLAWLLMGGREVWGQAYATLPMHTHVNPLRYLTALQIVALIAASYALHGFWLVAYIRFRGRWVLPTVLSIITLMMLTTHYQFVSKTLRSLPSNSKLLHRVAGQLAVDSKHRFMVSGDYGTGSHFHRDYLPMLADRAQLQSYALGYHATFSTYYAEHMKLEPNSLRLFNVSTLVARNDRKPPSCFKLHRGIGKYRIYRLPKADSWGYFELVRPGPVASGNLRELRPKISRLAPKVFGDGMVIILKPSAISPPTITDPPSYPKMALGTIKETKRSRLSYEASVHAQPGAWLLLKVNYFPFWSAQVDGIKTPIQHVGPNFMAIALPGGVHEVRFTYQNPTSQKIGALVSLSWVLGWFGLVLRRRRSAQRRS